jgi:predicted MFS family arabinose efflux permease
MQFHYGGFVMGILLSVFALSGAISGIILGYLNDTGVSLKRLVLFGIMFKIIGNILYFIGINIYVVVISRLIAGIGMGLVVRELFFFNINKCLLLIFSHHY